MSNNNQFIENTALAFVIYCDENGLSVEAGEQLADDIFNAMLLYSSDREAYAS